MHDDWTTLRRIEDLARQQHMLELDIDAHRLDMIEAKRMQLWRERQERLRIALGVLWAAMTWPILGVVAGVLLWVII